MKPIYTPKGRAKEYGDYAINNADDILWLLKRKSDAFDKAKIGKLNYHPSDIDWAAFGWAAEDICRKLGLDYYIKDSLRKEMEGPN